MTQKEDEAIERVLSGLRTVAMPAGMERRIAAAMKERVAAGETERQRFWLMRKAIRHAGSGGSGLRVRPLAAAGVAAVLATLFAVIRLAPPGEHEGTTHSAGSSAAATQTGAGRASRAEADLPAALPVGARPKTEARAERASVQAQPTGVPEGRVGVRATASKRTAAGRRVESYPAPVAPLSAQERALLRVARTGEPQQIAMLDPVARAKRNADDETEFNRFAGQAVKADHE